VNRRQDHAGAMLMLMLFRWCLHAQVYDTRHWNDEIGGWQVESKVS
jgi:hypothetical protein